MAPARPATLLLLGLGALLIVAAPATAGRTLAQDQAGGSGGGGATAANPTDVFASIEEPLLGGAQNATQPASASGSKFGLAPGVGAPGGEQAAAARLPAGPAAGGSAEPGQLPACSHLLRSSHSLLSHPASHPLAGEPRLKFTGIATVAYEAQPITPFGAAKLGCSLGFVSPTFQVRLKGCGLSRDAAEQLVVIGSQVQVRVTRAPRCPHPIPAPAEQLCGGVIRPAATGPGLRALH